MFEPRKSRKSAKATQAFRALSHLFVGFVVQSAGQRVAMNQDGVVQYLHGDHLGSTSLATNSSSGGEVTGSRTLYYPYGEERWSASGGTLATEYQFTGQRREQGIGLYDYNARFYDPALGRFISADSIVPDPGNPQAFNRYSYVLGNPLKYTDPTGHFEEDEIRRYLGNQFSHITDDDERAAKVEAVFQQWRTDKEEWWDIIGPGGATYLDILDGTKLDLFGGPGNRMHGQFLRDEDNDTFYFSGEEYILEIPGGMGCWDAQEFNSLVEFYDVAEDIIWMRHFGDAGWSYLGGTGYAAGGASMEWEDWRELLYATGFSAGAAASGITGLAALATANPLGGFGLVGFGIGAIKTTEHNAYFMRSVNAALRVNSLEQ